MAKIKVENITKVFNKHSRNANQVLKGVSFELPEKGLVAIYGKSGSGKTTLLNIIGGLEKQDGGKVYIDGECTSGKADKIRNAKIGFIFQNYYLEKGYTLIEILHNQLKIAGFHDEEEIKRRTEEALKLVDMWRYKNKQGNALSGGQQQRVAIARALVKGGDIILADEPTGNLDAENTVKVMDILKEISKTKLVVIVTHEITLIQKYADSHIKIVDGRLVEDGEITESELAAATYGDAGNAENTALLTAFTKSKSKRNGRLFSVKNIFKALKGDGEEKAYSTGNIFKQIFILAMAVVMCFFAFACFEAINTAIEDKEIGANTVYTRLNTYQILRNIDESLYEDIDFFETQMREGTFQYENVAAISGITENYVSKAIGADDSIGVEYGAMPESGEVLISRELAERLKKDLRLSELQNDRSMLLLLFEGEYRVSGIVDGSEPQVWFNKVDYVNFLGVYSEVSFVDKNGLFFSADYVNSSFTAEICVAEESERLENTQVIVELNRNSLYRMMNDTTDADYLIDLVNLQLKTSTTAIYISDSKPMYVKSFRTTRSGITTDIKIYVSSSVLDNVFMYLSPNLDAFGSSSDYYFKITAGEGSLDTLVKDLSQRGIAGVDIAGLYEEAAAQTVNEATKSLMLYFVIMILLYLIYFFIEKSGSVKNSKEYGVYRAIGVNKSNLLFKEFITALKNNFISYFLFYFIVAMLICIRYAIMNVAFGGFIGFAVACFALSALIMAAISLIPYLFVLYMQPASILARYDI